MKKIIVIISSLLILVIIAVLIWQWYTAQQTLTTITTFEACANAGYPIMESFPAQCRTPDGQTFTQLVTFPSPDTDHVRVTSPTIEQPVTSPLTITGEARGTWFFEASFPIHLEDATGTRVATVVAQAGSDWMTTDFVPFQATMVIPTTLHGPATLIFEKDNPSGLPEHAASVRFPITIK